MIQLQLLRVVIFQVKEVTKNANPEDRTSNKLIQLKLNYILIMCYVLSIELMSVFFSVLYLDRLVLNFSTALQKQERCGEAEFTV